MTEDLAVKPQVTLLDALVEQLVESSRVNASVQVKPAALLRPDAADQWLPVIDLLRQRLAGLVSLGEHLPSAAQGPSIWIKGALAGLVRGTLSNLCARTGVPLAQVGIVPAPAVP